MHNNNFNITFLITKVAITVLLLHAQIPVATSDTQAVELKLKISRLIKIYKISCLNIKYCIKIKIISHFLSESQISTSLSLDMTPCDCNACTIT